MLFVSYSEIKKKLSEKSFPALKFTHFESIGMIFNREEIDEKGILFLTIESGKLKRIDKDYIDGYMNSQYRAYYFELGGVNK